MCEEVKPAITKFLSVGIVLACAASPLQGQQAITLHQAIQIGLAQNPEAAVAGDTVALARSQLAQARLRPNPRLYLQSEDLHPWDANASFADGTEDYGYLSQTFELDRKRHKRVTYANLGIQRSEAERTLRLRRIEVNIANAYWSASATRQEAAEWQQQLADLERTVQYQSDRVHAGATAGVDLLRTQIERDLVALSAAQAQRAAETAAIELTRQTASPALMNAKLTDLIESQHEIAEIPVGSAVEQRADVKAAQDAVDEAKSDQRLQHANAVPDLDFLGGYKRDVGINTLYAGMQVDLPFFNRNQGGIARADADLRLAQDQLAAARLAAATEIKMAWNDYQREQELVRSTLPGMNDRAAQNATIIGEAYRSGGADLLRYLDAERVLIETRLQSIQTWADYQRAVVSLQLAYGEEP